METVFKDNPSLDVVYKTEDGKFFYTEDTARNYAKNLENKKVTKLVRESQDARVENQDTRNKTQDVNAEHLKELKELELVPKNYNKMKSLASALGLEVKGNKAEYFIQVLENYKQKNIV